MKNKVMVRAKALHAQKIADAKNEANALRLKLFSYEDVSLAYKKYIQIISECTLKCIDPTEKSKTAYDEYLAILKKYGTDDTFGYKPFCDKCNDTGFYNGKMCDCFKQEYIDALFEICEIDVKAPFSFDDANFKAIKDKKQQQELEKAYSLMQSLVNKYPNIKKHNVVISGKPGTGKTCLASAMAIEAAKKGHTVKFMSSYEFNADMIKCHISPIQIRSELLEDVLTADYLVIDDLGTEPITQKVTVEYLILVLNERTLNNKVTIITTNLETNNLKERYGERISSRLSDKSNTLLLPLHGQDIRMDI